MDLTVLAECPAGRLHRTDRKPALRRRPTTLSDLAGSVAPVVPKRSAVGSRQVNSDEHGDRRDEAQRAERPQYCLVTDVPLAGDGQDRGDGGAEPAAGDQDGSDQRDALIMCALFRFGSLGRVITHRGILDWS
ncbi:hypothetical protein [Actinoplanes awajinensis]|uniref:hypothetical protein n=1 Tax=Actinoplanes awajinensis TaxID=135946 RepID=UPI0012FA9FBA|nr:hypothetical protein [Actinoplanes awajinensis]